MTRTVIPLLPSRPAAPHVEPAVPPTRRLRVALVNMPWARVNAPSIQCGLLQSIARRAGHDCDTHYLNIEFAAFLGGPGYDKFAMMDSLRLHFLGEWLFSYAAFGEVRPTSEYLATYPEVVADWSEWMGGDLEHLVTTQRETLPKWINDCATRSEWGTYDVIGFTSTFLQTTAALALGRAIKAAHPQTALVYGGANFDSDMGLEYAQKLPWLDYVVAGEGDVTFPALLNAIADGRDVRLPGVHRYGEPPEPASPTQLGPAELDELPVPAYRDYFDALDRFGRNEVLVPKDPIRLPVEFSRGCWWGAKHHCTFCGLNALNMAFRSKSGRRAVDELATLLREYQVVHVDAVDNILDMQYLTSFCAELAERHWDVNMFFEVKANLTREQIRTMKLAGIMRVQPGIESLSSNVLRLMRKGSGLLINVRLLKWARYYGIRVAWNLLAGFPGETDEDYAEQLRLIPLLYHLEPPTGCQRIWLERFSPYFTDESFPMANKRPQESYRHIFPTYLDHAKIAYFYQYEPSGTCSDSTIEAMNAAVDIWQERDEQTASLVMQRLPGRVTIIDRRTAEPRRLVLTGWRAGAYDACGDTARTPGKVRERLAADGFEVDTDRVARFLDGCCRTGIMISDEGKYLGLALPENPGW
ncbi:RiPP maturation radical SAM C-methyltransferase [Micromonospora zamorensis]|uniref:RiPP maturation radical SAM C-methyltransferase n=1 Tax=Micromonospora zamorensis TaxID=709883 RepID=UPI003D958607